MLAAKLPLPKRVFGHGWILSDDKKMSKSLGNILDPIEIIKNYGIDQLRYYLVKEVSLGNDGSVSMENLTNSMGVLVVAGPKSRQLFEKISNDDFSNEAFPWLSGKMINVGLAETLALRVNFVGELGWELHMPIDLQNTIFDALMEAGEEFEIKPFGIRAMDSLRIEKSYRLVGTELSIEYAAYESGLDRFVHPNKGDFIGRDALVQWREKGFDNKFVTLEVHDVTDADALGLSLIHF